MTRPMQFAVYKGKGKASKWGAAQFELIPAQTSSEEIKSHKEGAVMLSMASTSAPDVYDWASKIVFKLGIPDLSALILFLSGGSTEVKLVHDPGAGKDTAGQVFKNLSLTSPQGLEKGCMMSLTQKSGESTSTHTVPLNAQECTTLNLLLRAALPRVLGW